MDRFLRILFTTCMLLLPAAGVSMPANGIRSGNAETGKACALQSVTPSDEPSSGEEQERRKVGLVLSGGGAKGVAHIGVIKVLEEAGIPIDYIAGTSMGAIIGGLYSIGWSTQELDSLVRNQDWMALLSDKIPRRDKLLSEKEITDMYILSVPLSLDKKFSIPSGVLAGQSVLNLLNEMTLGYHDDDLDFDSLPIPFACVAYDMVKGEEQVYRHGNLPLAIRASMSIPGAFAPVIRDSMVLVDGGIYNNFPVDVARDMGADIIIGVDLAAGPHDMEGLTSMMGLIDQITTFLGRDEYTKNLQDVDLYLKPDIKPYNSGSFNPEAVDSLLVRGERCARQNWDKIVALQDSIYTGNTYMIRKERILASDTDSVRIGNIEFVGLTRNEETFLRPSFGIDEQTVITKGHLNVPAWLKNTILATAMMAAVATAMAEILGGAIALQMLFSIPIKLGSMMILVLVLICEFTSAYKRIEKLIIVFVSLIGFSFLFEVWIADIDWAQAAVGWVKPSFPEHSMPVILSVLGAVVMPHNLFLHSEIIQSRQWNLEDDEVIARQLKYEFKDTLFSMIIGWAINSAMILMAAATFFQPQNAKQVYPKRRSTDRRRKQLLRNAQNRSKESG